METYGNGAEPPHVLRPGERIVHPQLGLATVVAVTLDDVTARCSDGSVRRFVATHPGIRQAADSEIGRIRPTWAELCAVDYFLPPLTGGEYRLARMLDEALPEGWRIYVRPHLDADRPLIAAIHPEAGGMIWDVVDWKPSDVRIEGGLWVRETEPAGRFASPFQLLTRVRERIYGHLVPALGEAIDEEPRRFGVIRAAIFFSTATSSEARAFKEQDPGALHLDAFGADAVDAGDLDAVLPILGRTGTLDEDLFVALDDTFSSDYRMPDAMSAIEPTRSQRRLVEPTTGYTAIEGVAGSGKTIVLAHRAARAAATDGRVLIVTYNRTLTNYVRGVLKRVPITRRKDAISVMHFHHLCRLVHSHHLAPLPPLRPDEGQDGQEVEVDAEALDSTWPASALRLIRERGVPDLLRFTSVYVDEAQDFAPSWFELLQALGASETVLAYDSAQRLYARDALTSRREIARLLGGKDARTQRLAYPVRLPRRTAELASGFAARWSLPTARLESGEDGLLPPDGTVRLLSTDTEADAAAATLAVLAGWQAETSYRARDVAVLVPTKSFGSAFVRQLAELGTSANHVFPVRRTGAVMEHTRSGARAPAWRVAQANKQAFQYDDARLKVSTVHSFKGWDAQRVIMILPSARPGPSTAAMVYVGLTRSRGDLVLIGAVDAFGLAGLLGEASERPPVDDTVRRRFEELIAEAAGRTPPTPVAAVVPDG